MSLTGYSRLGKGKPRTFFYRVVFVFHEMPDHAWEQEYYRPLSFAVVKNGLELVFNVNGNLKSENFQDYAQKTQRNCTFMSLASVEDFPILTSREEGG
jgi:hypothetical protein